MDSVIEKYIDDVRGLLPIHRLLLFLLALPVCVLIRSGAGKPMIVEVLTAPATFDAASEIFGRAMVADYFIAAAFLIGAWLIHRGLFRAMISSVWVHLGIEERLNKEYEEIDSLNLEGELRAAALQYASEEAVRRVGTSKLRAIIAEFCLGFGFLLLLSSVRGAWLDAIFGIGLLVVGLIFQACSFLYYLRYVLPFALNASALSGLRRRLGMPDLS